MSHAIDRKQAIDTAQGLLLSYLREPPYPRTYDMAVGLVDAILAPSQEPSVRVKAPAPKWVHLARTEDGRYEDSDGGEWWAMGPPQEPSVEVTDEMAKRFHDTLRAEGWNDLHSWDETGENVRATCRAALAAALCRLPAREGPDKCSPA